MSKIELVRDRSKASDRSIKSFTGVVSNEVVAWEAGDVVTFPSEIKDNAFETKINGRAAQYLLVTAGEDDVRQFFPSIVRRRVRVCEEGETLDNGTVQAVLTNEYETCSGTVVDDYRKCVSINEFVELCIQKKKLKFTNVKEVPTNRFGTMEFTTGKVYQLDWVEDEKKK